METDLPLTLAAAAAAPAGRVELVADAEHLRRVVTDGILRAKVSVEIATADLKAMLVPDPAGHVTANRSRRRSAPSILDHLARLADRGVEIRVLHSGVPSSAALRRLRGKRPPTLTLRRCPRIHMKAVIVDGAAMYLGSANLTGAGLGAKGPDKRNFELGVWTTAADLIDAVGQRFNSIWEGRPCETCQLRDICPVPLEEPDLSPIPSKSPHEPRPSGSGASRRQRSSRTKAR